MYKLRRRRERQLGGAVCHDLGMPSSPTDDPDTVIGAARAAGATVTSPAGDEHGWRLGRITDPFGHHWEIGKPTGPWPPEQHNTKRAALGEVRDSGADLEH